MLTFYSAYFFLEPIEGHKCILKKRPDPSVDGTLRWSLLLNEKCFCQEVVVQQTCEATHGHHCAANDLSCMLWFVNDTEVGNLTRRHNWNKESLDRLLERTGYCGMF